VSRQRETLVNLQVWVLVLLGLPETFLLTTQPLHSLQVPPRATIDLHQLLDSGVESF